MNVPEDLSAQMADKTNDQLLAMLKQPEEWLPDALEAARAELRRREIDLDTINADPPPIPDQIPSQTGEPLFFSVSLLKLLVMSTVTLGLYDLYWFYKNWTFVKERTARDISPFWR